MCSTDTVIIWTHVFVCSSIYPYVVPLINSNLKTINIGTKQRSTNSALTSILVFINPHITNSYLWFQSFCVLEMTRAFCPSASEPLTCFFVGCTWGLEPITMSPASEGRWTTHLDPALVMTVYCLKIQHVKMAWRAGFQALGTFFFAGECTAHVFPLPAPVLL